MGAHTAFRRSIQRAKNLLEIHASATAIALTKADGTALHAEALDDLLRSAVVLTVSAMDSYFHDRFSEMLVPYLRRHGPNPSLAKHLESCGVNVEFLLQLFNKKRPLAHVRRKVDQRLFTKPLHSPEEINSLFQKYKVDDLLKAVADARRIAKKTLKQRLGCR